MKTIVIAAGYATRLGELTKNFPKPLLKIGDNTILGRLLDDIDPIEAIAEHIIVTNHRFAPIFEKWASEQHYTKPITIVDDGTNSNEERLGAVGDLLYVMDQMQLNDDLLVVAADNLLFFHFRDFVAFAQEKQTSCIMYHEQPSIEKLQRTGVVVLDENNRVLEMAEKPQQPKTRHAVPPFYIYLQKDFDLIRHALENGCGNDAPGNLAHYLVEHTPMHAWPMDGDRFDIGSLDTYYEACKKYGAAPKEQILSIIQVPMWYGSDKRGVEQAPPILGAALQESIGKNYQVEQCTIPIPKENLSKESNDRVAKYVDYVTAVNKDLSEQVASRLNEGHLVMTIGGDHSIGLGSVAGSLQYDKNIGLIWFDAHCDMNTEATSPTGNIHGMPIAALMGKCSSTLNDIATRRIQPQHIFWIGARSLDAGEQVLAQQMHLHIYSTDEIHRQGMSSVMKQVGEEMVQMGIEHVHVSFDVDAFDPQVFPATGVKVAKGLVMDDFEQFVPNLSMLPKVMAMDFVEYNPLLDNEQKDCEQLAVLFLKQLLTAYVG